MTKSSKQKSFAHTLGKPLTKENVSTLQINLGRRCNLACSHCHVEAGPHRTEELSEKVLAQILEIIDHSPQIKTIDLTGGAPEMNNGFERIVEKARSKNMEVIVRSNLTIFYVVGYEHLPEYFAKQKVRVVASLPCYLKDNVDTMRGKGVFEESVDAIKQLNSLGYGKDLILDLVYNPQLPSSEEKFSLPPPQENLEKEYKKFLMKHFHISFNNLLTISNIPIGRMKSYLKRKGLLEKYISFLARHFNPKTVSGLMCKTQLSIDYDGNVYDCDFHQMEKIPALSQEGEPITLDFLLQQDNLNIIKSIPLKDYCYGCTAGCGSSCGGQIQ